MNNRVNVIFLYKDGRGEDQLIPKCDIFKKCRKMELFGDSPINRIYGPTGQDRDFTRMFASERGDQVFFSARLIPRIHDVMSGVVPRSPVAYYEKVLKNFGVSPDPDFREKTIIINGAAMDNGHAAVELEEAIRTYSHYLEPAIVLTDGVDLVGDPYFANHYAQARIEAMIEVRYRNQIKDNIEDRHRRGQKPEEERAFSHAAEQLLSQAFNGALEKDERTEMTELGLIFKAASTMLQI
ncbi:hypothetical protein IKT64_02915 [Candidatus Saccharibacteria bacterium]|nr:hypothetical protein [Candidatus Saccharibacteria bacterium]